MHILHFFPLNHMLLQASFEELSSLAPTAHLSINDNTVAFPSNVSGTYKGSWSMPQSDANTHAMPVLKQGQGTVAFQLAATSTGTDEVLDVQVVAAALRD